jgi:hypothetical protein
MNFLFLICLNEFIYLFKHILSRVYILALIILRYSMRSSLIVNLLLSHTNPLIEKNRSTPVLVDGILLSFKNKSNSFGIPEK